jgi:hypothetical protein
MGRARFRSTLALWMLHNLTVQMRRVCARAARAKARQMGWTVYFHESRKTFYGRAEMAVKLREGCRRKVEAARMCNPRRFKRCRKP